MKYIFVYNTKYGVNLSAFIVHYSRVKSYRDSSHSSILMLNMICTRRGACQMFWFIAKERTAEK